GDGGSHRTQEGTCFLQREATTPNRELPSKSDRAPRIATHSRRKPSATRDRNQALGALLGGLRLGITFWQQGSGEVDAGKIRAGQIRFPQNGYSHVSARKSGPFHVGQTQIHVAQSGALKIY